MQTLTFKGTVPTKKNKQRIGISPNGRPLIYKPKSVKEFEQMVADEILVQRGKFIDGPLQVGLYLVYDSKAEPDLDGSLTTLLDAMQDAGLFNNDRNVRKILECEKRVSAGTDDPPRAIVTIGRYDE